MEWDHASAFQQSAPYAAAAVTCGARVGRGVFDGVPVQWLDRRGMRLISRSDAPRHVLRHLARHAGVTVATGAAQGWGLVPMMTARYVALWEVTAEPDVLRAGMAGKWRNRLTAAQASVRVARGGDLAVLLAHESVQRTARGYRALPADFTRALPKGALHLWQWRHGGALGAAMCFVRHGTWATYHIGWASEAARHKGVHGVMLWQAAMALRAEGVRVIDLGDVNTDAAPGLARFKLGTGAGLVSVGQTAWVLPG